MTTEISVMYGSEKVKKCFLHGLHEKIIQRFKGYYWICTALFCRNIAAHRITPLEDYLAMVEKRLVCPGCDAEETQAMEDIKLELMTPDGYTTYLGAETASKAGFTLQEILVDCHVSFRVGVGFIHRNCDDFFNITLLFYSKYFNCFRYDPIPTSTVVLDSSKNLTLNATPSQMVMILNLANDHVSSVYNPRATSWHSAGAYVMVTDPREVQPAVGFDGVNVPVGMLSNIGVSLTERVTMVPPHGECVPSDIDKSREEIKNCFVNRVRETCGCIDVDPIFHVNVSDMRTMSDEYCMSLAHGYSNMMKNIQCVLAARQGNLSCFNNLSRMCEEHNYKKVVSHSHWPVRTHLPSVASFLTKNSASLRPRQLHLFNRAKNCKADSTSSECVELLKQTEVEILNSFAQFCVGASDYMYISMVDEAKVGWSEFSSQIGGILNLWSGITAVLLLEILEMLYRTLRGWVQPVEPEIHNDRDASSVTCPKCGSTDRLPSNYYNNKPVWTMISCPFVSLMLGQRCRHQTINQHRGIFSRSLKQNGKCWCKCIPSTTNYYK